MTTKAIDKLAKSDRLAVARRATRAPAAKIELQKLESPPVQPGVEGHVTKHAQLLDLLKRSEGASIVDMMEATGWQRHSVRGFLAGTVKKKLGLALASSRAEGEVRRYRIARARRGR